MDWKRYIELSRLGAGYLSFSVIPASLPLLGFLFFFLLFSLICLLSCFALNY